MSAALLATACASDPAGPGGVEVADGWRVEVVRDDLQAPTQLAMGADGHLYVADLAGGEQEGEGRVLDLGLVEDPTAAAAVVLDGLLTPTGLAATDEAVWVQERTELVRFTGAPGALGPREVMHAVAAFNGRSQGTLTVLPDGRVVHTATAPDAAPGDEPELLAIGFRNAYAHAVDPLFPDSYHVVLAGPSTCWRSTTAGCCSPCTAPASCGGSPDVDPTDPGAPD